MNLVGRATELELVGAFLRSASVSGGSLLLRGDPGVGKSALLDEAVRTAGSDARVVRSTGVEFETAASLAGLEKLVRPLLDHLHRLHPAHRTAVSVALDLDPGPGPDRLVLCSAVVALIHSVSADRPLIMIVDDAHWLDSYSAAILGFVARRLTGSRAALLAAERDDDAGILGSAGLPAIDLQPLAEDDASGLLGSHFPDLPARVRQRVLSEAQGNPLALLELPAAASRRQRFGSTLLPEVLPLSERLIGLFAGRIESLPAPTRQLLLLAALEGAGDLRVVRDAGPPGPGIGALAPAETARLVSMDHDRFRVAFRHPLIRSAVVALADTDERRLAHRALSRVLLGQPERRTWHLAQAAEGPDESVARRLEEQAGHMLRCGDAVGAVNSLSRAVELSPRREDRARRQIEAAYIDADVTGDLKNASDLLESARDADPASVHSLAVAVTASYLLLNAECELDVAHQLLVRAIAAHRAPDTPHDQALDDALHQLLMLCWFGDRPELWRAFEASIERFGARVPSLVLLCRNTFGDPVHGAGSALDRLTEEIATLRDERNPVRITRVAIACVYTDRLSECREALGLVIRDGRAGGAVALAINALVSTCVEDWLTGRWDEVQQLATEGVELCERHGYRRYSLILGGYLHQVVSVARGEPPHDAGGAEPLAEWAAPRGVGMATTFEHHLRALQAAGIGDDEQAYQHARAISPPGLLGPYRPHALWVLFDLVISAVRTGRHDEAVAHVTAIREADLGAISPRLAMLSLGCQALTATDDHASDLFRAALRVRGAERWPFDRARIQLAYGEWLRRTDASPGSSREPLRDALESFERLGAAPWADRARNELRAAGRAGATPLGGGAAALTTAELQIARLAASGLTNRQIGDRLSLSHRTVGARLYRVFPKLGITTRASLREALREDR